MLSKSGRIYTGVCIDTCSTLGICAERNAIFNMITNGEHEIDKVLAIMPEGLALSGIFLFRCRFVLTLFFYVIYCKKIRKEVKKCTR